MFKRFVDSLRVFMIVLVVFVFMTGNVFAGEWSNTKEDVKFWNEYPFAGQTFSWSGQKDANNYAQGKGKLTTYLDNEIVEVFEGNMETGKFQGKATIDIVGIAFYEGNVVDCKMHGKGSLTWTNGESYKGDFVNNNQQGKGIYTWSDGSAYDGDFANNKRNGKGTLKWPNGDSYSGMWSDSMENGKGISKSAIKATIKDGKMQITFVLKYGNMPFVMNCSSNATKK